MLHPLSLLSALIASIILMAAGSTGRLFTLDPLQDELTHKSGQRLKILFSQFVKLLFKFWRNRDLDDYVH